ncbi:AraC family transcriptional regulator [Burkholderia sp. 22PA0106]|uniref:AraC family transcriptional regulator n=1 Tax=Burkholderia sp. 22PA0106 TaxID=3237371 RepID=UPI0039C49AB1
MSFVPLIPDGDLRVQQRIIELLGQLAPSDGVTDATLEGVRFMRVSTTLPRCPVLYEPSIVIVCQGRKVGYVGERTFVYDERQYLVLSVPLPFECETYTAPHGPFLAITVRIDLGVIAELAMLLEETHGAAVSEPDSICSTPLDAPLADAVLRLLEVLQSPHDTRVLGPSIMREIGYRVLTGEQGDGIRAALAQQHHFGRIAKALRRIHVDLGGEHSVDVLAAEAGMSAAVFHAHFRRVTGTSPMQYVKATRLHHARLMLVQQNVSASVAAARVGYVSASQFSREFKRMFGRSPGDEVRWVQSANGAVASDAAVEVE